EYVRLVQVLPAPGQLGVAVRVGAAYGVPVDDEFEAFRLTKDTDPADLQYALNFWVPPKPRPRVRVAPTPAPPPPRTWRRPGRNDAVALLWALVILRGVASIDYGAAAIGLAVTAVAWFVTLLSVWRPRRRRTVAELLLGRRWLGPIRPTPRHLD